MDTQEIESSKFDWVDKLTILSAYQLYRKHLQDNPVHTRIMGIYGRIFVIINSIVILVNITNSLLLITYSTSGLEVNYLFFSSITLLVLYCAIIILGPFLYTKSVIHRIWNQDDMLKSTPISDENLLMGIVTPYVFNIVRLMIWISILAIPYAIITYLNMYKELYITTFEAILVFFFAVTLIVFATFSNALVFSVICATSILRTLLLNRSLNKAGVYTIFGHLNIYILYITISLMFSIFSVSLVALLSWSAFESNYIENEIQLFSIISRLMKTIFMTICLFFAYRVIFWKKDIQALKEQLVLSRSNAEIM
ncbi:MAG: hypothetical protein SFY68_08330 [Candidatus Sumerlaeia bacterium]|nr:hypothetical protein [Candidatus Sumerlaeia bacterium]